mgnify:CR=1 FL=1
MKTPTAYPLHWPDGWPRHGSRSNSQFKTNLEGAINNVEKSLKQFASDSGKRTENIMVSSNYSMMDRNPRDPGVAVYFTWDGISTCIAVDRYNKIQENLQAIHHCIEAERTKLRHGGINLVRAAFRGYAALPPPQSKRSWWDVLQVPQDASLDDCEKMYKYYAKSAHPDSGGSAEKMAELNTAIADARREKR